MNKFKFICLLTLLSSCGEDVFKIERLAQQQADSLFLVEYPTLVHIQDSICQLNKQLNRNAIIDSIVEVRKQQIIDIQKSL
jgi:hypothetical protein